MNNITLSTQRLELIAATLEHLCAELDAPERLASPLNAQVAPGWPPGEYDRDAQEFFRDRLKEGGSAAIGWYSWYAVRRATPGQPPALVGAGGYFGPPGESGEIEIGFSVIPAWQALGYATEIARALVERAFADVHVNNVIAHTAPENLASRKVLEKCGFHYVGLDADSGNCLFEIQRNTAS
ncbi:acetyltransferase, GNAT family protein [Candidatus Vecturithrix granuli]|uniref:Acetyltransferase, GNAT family protein n=1 Tax=Vecturithrix granuli TaxID=1499967 RepID=A0A081BZ65_VECG1|nr:acetyltransferase, GNAT family protein [Candidatus Vecturithrix granuli]